MTSNSANFSFNCRVFICLYIFVSAKILSLHKKSNHIFSRIIVKGIFFPNTTTQQQRLHITTPTTNPTIRKIRIVNMSVLFEYNFSFPFIPHSYQNVISPTPSPKPLSFLAPPPIRSKSASRTAYQIPKRNAITQTPTPKASKKAIPTPPTTKPQRKPLKKTFQNNPSNSTN